MKTEAPTFESVWAAIQESNRILTEKLAETGRQLKESSDKFDKRIDKLAQMTGGLSLGYGSKDQHLKVF